MIKDFAFIKDNKIIQIARFEDPTEEILETFKNDLMLDHIIEVFDNTRTLGGTYDGVNLWPPQPKGWIKNEETISFDPPIPYPEIDLNNPKNYAWNENTLNWEEVQY